LIVELVPKDYLFPRGLSKLEGCHLGHSREPNTRETELLPANTAVKQN